MADQYPVIVGLSLDHETDDILEAAKELGQRLKRPLLVVHAISERRLESEKGQAKRIAEAKGELVPHLEKLRAAGLVVEEEVAIGRPADLVIETAQRIGAELIITGGGRPATVRRWLVGSVAEAVVRHSSAPVWIARGAPPIGRPVLCPVDLSPQSKLGLAAAIRMARAFGSPLRVMTVLTDLQLNELDEDEDVARGQVDALLAAHDVDGLEVSVNVDSGIPAAKIVEAAADAGLLVVGSRGFDPLIPDWLGPVTTRTLRHSRCSALTIREVDVDLERREHAIANLAHAHREVRRLLEEQQPQDALPLIEGLAERAPANAEIQETFAITLERVGRNVEARGRHEIAKMIRKRIVND